jgi:hypothetical protein
VSEGKWRGKSGDEELGSLAQSARQTSLKQARGILIVIGLLTLVLNGIFFANAENEVRQVIDAEKAKLGPGMVVDPAKAKEAEQKLLQMCRLVYGGTAFLGLVFVVLGIAVYKAPVACTVTGLVLYVAGNAVFAAIEPLLLIQGIIVKIIIVVALVKAVQAALAYEREARAATRAARTDDPHEGEDEHR